MKRGTKILVTNDSGFKSVGKIEKLHRDGTATAKVHYPTIEGEGYITLHVDGTCECSQWYKPGANYQNWAYATDSDTKEACRVHNFGIMKELREEDGREERQRILNDLSKLGEIAEWFEDTQSIESVGSGLVAAQYVTGQLQEHGEWVGILIADVQEKQPEETYSHLYGVDVQYYIKRQRSSGASYVSTFGETPEGALRNAIRLIVKKERGI
jgi:hypothetical protein